MKFGIKHLYIFIVFLCVLILFWSITEMLQKILEKPLEKKAGRNYGPPGNKTLIYFLDDMNMPEVK